MFLGLRTQHRAVGAREPCHKLSHDTCSLLSNLQTGKPLVNTRSPLLRGLRLRGTGKPWPRVEARSCHPLPGPRFLSLGQGRARPSSPASSRPVPRGRPGRGGERKRPSLGGVPPDALHLQGRPFPPVASQALNSVYSNPSRAPGTSHSCILTRLSTALTGDCPPVCCGSPEGGQSACGLRYIPSTDRVLHTVGTQSVAAT